MADDETGPERGIEETKSGVGTNTETVGTGTRVGAAVGMAVSVTTGTAVEARVAVGSDARNGFETGDWVAVGNLVRVPVGIAVGGRVSSPAHPASTNAEAAARILLLKIPGIRSLSLGSTAGP